MAVNPPLNPILMLLEGNGSLQGRDRSGLFSATGSGALRYAPAPGARVNYLPNPGFLNAATGWTNAGTTGVITRVADARFESGFAGNIAANGNANDGALTVTSDLIGTAPGGIITVSFDCTLEAGPDTNWVVRVIEAGGSSLWSGSSTAFLPTAGKSRIVLQIPLHATAIAGGYDSIQIYIRRSDAVAGTIRVSSVQLELGATAGSIIAAPIWLSPITGQIGTPHASPSASRAVFWIEEGTTNLCLNPRGAANTNHWAVAGTGLLGNGGANPYTYFTAERSGTTPFGMITGPTGAVTVAQGEPLTVACDVQKDVGTFGVAIRIRYFDGAGATGTQLGEFLSGQVTPTGAPQRLSITGTAPAGAVSAQIATICGLNGSNGDRFRATRFQFKKKTYATSYADGAIGTGFTWASTAHASASTRTQALVTAPVATHISSVSNAIVARATMPDNGLTASLLSIGAFGVNDWMSLQLLLGVAQNPLSMSSKVGAAGSEGVNQNGFAADVWGKYYGDASASQLRVAVNHNAPSSVPRANAPTGTTSTNITCGNASGYYLSGLLGPVVTYQAPLSDARRALVNTAIDSNGEIDLWTLFEEWEGIIQPADLLALQSGQATAGVTADAQPYDLLALQSGQATAGVAAEVDALDMSMMGEELVATAPRPFPYLVTWRSP